MTWQGLAELAGDALALGIALLGWFIHVRTCREQLVALRAENERLLELLGRLMEQRR